MEKITNPINYFKKSLRYFLLILFYFLTTIIYAQTCGQDGINLSTQADIDDFAINYPNCTTVEGNLIINGTINNLNGLSQLIEINGLLEITSDNLTSLEGLHNLNTISNISIANCPILTNINILSNFSEIDSLNIFRCDSLTSLQALSNLNSITDSLDIVWNPSLVNLMGLENLVDIEGHISIGLNNITSLNGLQNLVSVGSLSIYLNNFVSSLQELESLTNIDHNLSISSMFNILNLNGLEGITYIGSELILHGNYILTSLDGLNNLQTVDGLDVPLGTFVVSIINNNALIDSSSLTSLETVNGKIEFRNNHSLQNIGEGMNNLSSTNNHYLVIVNNPSLETINGFELLEEAGLYIANNAQLEGISGFNSVLTGSLEVFDNPSLQNIDIFNSATAFWRIWVSGNESLTNITGFAFAESISDRYIIGNNPSLLEIPEMQNLQTIGNSLNIYENHEITNLNGLSALTNINGNLDINNNSVLSNITGLSNLTSIEGGYFQVNGNNILSSLDGIENIDPNSIYSISIQENPNLAVCNVASICNFLEGYLGPYYINDNAPGCESGFIIAENCGFILGTSSFDISSFNMYPNPTGGILNFSTPLWGEIVVFNQLGQKVQSKQANTTYIDLTQLENGLYFLQIEDQDGQLYVKKIIKK